jgi:nitroimidazol reductase NimA-like FMN-containing flavoprotein (pyridoxamine 5'-phosphate oxidase superfamily)
MNLIQKAQNEISNRLYITLATVDSCGLPWNAPVYFANDEKYNIYWISESTSIHSQNISHNNKVMAVIYDSTVPHGAGFGVYIQGYAHELNENESFVITKAIDLMGKKIGSDKKYSYNDFLSPSPRRIYEMCYYRIYVNTIVKVNDVNVDRRIDITTDITL